MALPTVCSLSRSLFSRGLPARAINSAFLSTRIPFRRRQFASSSRLLQEAVEQSTPSSSNPPPRELSDAQKAKNARSVAVMMASRHTVKSDLIALFQDAGLEIADIQMRLDRFTFYSDTYSFIELKNERQAQKAVKLLNGNESLGRTIVVRPLAPNFVWRVDEANRPHEDLGHCVLWNEHGLDTAIQPILDHRRIYVAVKTPGWGDTAVRKRGRESYEVLRRTFGKFGIESISAIAPNKGDLKFKPRYLCFIDFATREGADEAIRAVHDTEVEGRLVWLWHSDIAPWKAYQIGRVDAKRLAKLQEKGLAPKTIGKLKH